MPSWWKKIAVEQLNADPALNVSWPKIICETIGSACVTQPHRSWPDKIAGYLNLQPTNNAEELGRYIYDNNLLGGSSNKGLAGIGTLTSSAVLNQRIAALLAADSTLFFDYSIGTTPADSSGSTTDYSGATDPPTVSLVSGGVTSGGTTTLHGKVKTGSYGAILYDILAPQASSKYTLEYTPDFSLLTQQGKLAMVGFGFKTNNDFYLIGLKGNGTTGLVDYQVWGSGATHNGWNKLTGQSTVTGSSPAQGTQAGPNYVQLEVSADGTSITFRTSADGLTWSDEATSLAIGPFANVSSVTDFGPAVWIDFADTGQFSVEFSLWQTAGPLNFSLSSTTVAAGAAIDTVIGTLTPSGGTGPYTFSIVSQ